MISQEKIFEHRDLRGNFEPSETPFRMIDFIAVRKEPRWIKVLGVVLLFFGLFALIPFKVEFLQSLDIPFYILAGIGVALIVLGWLRIGWRLNLEGNVLYYVKFNLYGNWKKRRANEFALGLDKITNVEYLGSNFVISYRPGKKLHFSTRGLSTRGRARLNVLKSGIESAIGGGDHA